MGNFAEKLVFIAAIALFLSGAVFLIWRESAQVNLKSGMRLYEQNSPGALKVLQSGVRKNAHDYRLHYGIARTLHKTGFAAMRQDTDARGKLIEARRSINNALALRFDSFGHQLLAFNYELMGERKNALAHYNISFFFSREAGDLAQWEQLRPLQADSAREYFNAEMTGIALIMAYNALTGFEPRPAYSSAEAFLSDFFLSAPPTGWLLRDRGAMKRGLKELFNKRTGAERDGIAHLLEEAGFGFLSRFLRSPA
jgi:hypothetical protein